MTSHRRKAESGIELESWSLGIPDFCNVDVLDYRSLIKMECP